MEQRIPASERPSECPSERLIVALDVDTPQDAWQIVNTLGDAVSFYKVGLQLFMRPGLSIVEQLVAQGKKVFLDLKIDDTPRTVQEAVRQAAIDGVEFFTLQGNSDTVKAAREGRAGRTTPKFLQVSFLSSWDSGDLKAHFGIPDGFDLTIEQAALARAEKSLAAGCEGVVASGASVRKIRERYGPDIIIVTPGIRPGGASTDDHKRSLAPGEAILAGSDYLVVGRPIRNAGDPRAVAAEIVAEIKAALATLSLPGS